MSEQPFYVGLTNPRGFRGVRNGYLPALEPKPVEEPEPIIQQKFLYFKNDIRAFELNKRVIELENSNQYLIRKIKELTANASKRRPKSKY